MRGKNRCRAFIFALLCLALLGSSCGPSEEKNIGKLPFGVMDGPHPGDVLRGAAGLSGWVLAETGVARVAVYVDRNFVAFAQTGAPRSDVAAAYPKIPHNQNSGWAVTLDTSAFPPGAHELVVQAVTKDGATRDLSSINVILASQ